MNKPYQAIPIIECGEPLLEVPVQLARAHPHPYQQLGAPYAQHSPYVLRETIIQRLLIAQKNLQQRQSSWRIQLFDGYRPLAVQQFMVDYTLQQLVQAENKQVELLTPAEKDHFYQQVYQFWALPSSDPATPPPHSTGGAVDVTLLGPKGEAIKMGSPIDEVSERSYPDYFADKNPIYHQRRQLLCQAMQQAGFQRHPHEWWHFSYGDQLWAWLSGNAHACYGRVE